MSLVTESRGVVYYLKKAYNNQVNREHKHAKRMLQNAYNQFISVLSQSVVHENGWYSESKQQST